MPYSPKRYYLSGKKISPIPVRLDQSLSAPQVWCNPWACAGVELDQRSFFLLTAPSICINHPWKSTPRACFNSSGLPLPGLYPLTSHLFVLFTCRDVGGPCWSPFLSFVGHHVSVPFTLWAEFKAELAPYKFCCMVQPCPPPHDHWYTCEWSPWHQHVDWWVCTCRQFHLHLDRYSSVHHSAGWVGLQPTESCRGVRFAFGVPTGKVQLMWRSCFTSGLWSACVCCKHIRMLVEVTGWVLLQWATHSFSSAGCRSIMDLVLQRTFSFLDLRLQAYILTICRNLCLLLKN